MPLVVLYETWATFEIANGPSLNYCRANGRHYREDSMFNTDRETNERQYRDARKAQEDDIAYTEGVAAYNQGWDDRENGRPDLSTQDTTGHYASGWEDADNELTGKPVRK